MKKRIKHWLILTQYYHPEIGAPQIRLRSLVRELLKKGIHVEVLTAFPNYPKGKIFKGYKGKFYMHENIDGAIVRRTWIYPGAGKSAFIRLVNYLSFTFSALLGAIMGSRPDVLFVESQPLSLGIVAIVMKWLRGAPYIYNVPDLQIEGANQLGLLKNIFILHFAWALEKYFLRHSWKVSTVTHSFIRHFESLGLPHKQITFLPNGADTNFLKPQPPNQEMLNRWGLHGKKVFLYVGTHAYYHGLETLVEAANLLKNKLDIIFLLIGEGPERHRLQKVAIELNLTNVIFGNSPYDEMDRLYSIAYASIATLRKIEVAKSMRLSKIFPSLSCGVPVIYSGFGEAAELLDKNKCGVVVPPERPDLLSEAIVQLSLNPALRDEFGLAGRNLIEKEYSWSIIVEHWFNELQITLK